MGPEPEPYVRAVRPYAEAGFDHIVLQNAGPDPDGFLDFFHKDLRDQLGAVCPETPRAHPGV